MSIVLASASPRRKELLEMLGVSDLKVIPATGEETAPEGAGPEEMVMAISSAKAMEVSKLCDRGDVVIAADTIVWHHGKVYGKPHSRQEAIEMLESLSGDTHQVFTGVTVMHNGHLDVQSEMSRVSFRQLTRQEIERYVDTGEPMDKAGAYGAQGKGSLFVRGIYGDFFNVMGLPLCRLGEMLNKQGVGLL